MKATDRLHVLRPDEWQARRRHHGERLAPWVEPHLERQSLAIKHPVYDFLFEYYSFRPSHLMSWSPGIGVVLEGAAQDEVPMSTSCLSPASGVHLDTAQFPERRVRSLDWVIELLRSTARREPRFRCFGLHEWAMVYRDPNVRHGHIPLRLAKDEIAQFVEDQAICCSHYDAFRFFTDPAKPLNQLQPTAQTRSEMEQPGCLHANMDLYKWAYKFYPWIPSDLIADAFLLAVEVRELDMRASPYDLSSYGFEPVCIETEAGRRIYQSRQKELAAKAEPLRKEVLLACERVRTWVAPETLALKA